jgi:2-dehydropantoate 2-reductase
LRVGVGFLKLFTLGVGMRILVVGAGAVGGYYGARLLQAGADVTFLVRPKQASELAVNDLVVESSLGSIVCRANTVQKEDVRPEYDLIVLACKTYDLESAMNDIAPAVKEGVFILPFINGIRAYTELDSRFGIERVLGGVAYIAITMAPSGEIVHLGAGDTVLIGPRVAAQRVIADEVHVLLSKTPGLRQKSANIDRELVDKWVLIASGAAMTCLMRGSVGDIMATSYGRSLISSAIGECCEILGVSGYKVSQRAMARMEGLLLDGKSGWEASMMRDVRAGVRRTEVDDVIGDFVERAARYGFPVPMLTAAFCHLKVYELQTSRLESRGALEGSLDTARLAQTYGAIPTLNGSEYGVL